MWLVLNVDWAIIGTTSDVTTYVKFFTYHTL